MPIDIDNIEDPRDEMMERAPFRNRETLEDDLTKFFATRMPDVSALSASARGAAMRFLGLIEPPKDNELVQTVGVPGKRDATRVIDPYYERAWHCAKRFTRLPKAHQQTIIDNAKACPWRGDDIAFYVRLIEETERMNEMGAAAYKAQAMGKLRAIIGGSV